MSRSLRNKELLKFLNQAQPELPWRSCEETRHCVACDREFRGSAVIVRQRKGEQFELACPGCGSPPVQWVHTGDPLTDERVWAQWQMAMEFAANEIEPELPAFC